MTATYHIPVFVAVMVAIIVAAKFKKLVNKFIDAGATTPKAAKTPEVLNIRPGLMFKRLMNRGVIIESGPERYYLNEENLVEYKKARRVRMMIILGALILLILLDVIILGSEF
jgi:hypothetical protein